MKTCLQCKRELVLSEFNKKGDGVQPWCRDCNRARSRRYYAENKDKHRRIMTAKNKEIRERNKEFVNVVKDVPCMDCGVKYPSYVMDLDHTSGTKISNVSTMARQGAGLERLQREINKCEVVCANCHRERTHQRGGIV